MEEEKVGVRELTHDMEQEPSHADLLRKTLDAINLLEKYLKLGLVAQLLDPDQSRLLGHVIWKLLRLYKMELKHRRGPRTGSEANVRRIEEWLKQTISTLKQNPQ